MEASSRPFRHAHRSAMPLNLARRIDGAPLLAALLSCGLLLITSAAPASDTAERFLARLRELGHEALVVEYLERAVERPAGVVGVPRTRPVRAALGARRRSARRHRPRPPRGGDPRRRARPCGDRPRHGRGRPRRHRRPRQAGARLRRRRSPIGGRRDALGRLRRPFGRAAQDRGRPRSADAGRRRHRRRA